MIEYHTLPLMISSVFSNYNNPNAFNYLKNDKWHSISTKEMGEQIKKASLALYDLGLKKGECVGIISDNSPFWIIMDISVMVAGGISVPMFPNVSQENMLLQTRDSNLKYLFIANKVQWDKLGDSKNNFTNIITLDIQQNDHPGNMDYEELLKKGERVKSKNPTLYAKLKDALKEDDIATIIYTIGSTGIPKGIEITHKNLCSQIKGAGQCFSLDHTQDEIISYLPLAHVFERMISYFFVSTGTSIYYVNDVKNLMPALREIKPTTMTVFPLLLTKIYNRLVDSIQQSKGPKKTLNNLAVKRAIKKNPFREKNFLDNFFDRLVYQKILSALGGNFKLMVCGGDALKDNIYRFFLNIGVPLYQGYGLTESSSIISCNYRGNNKVGTVGKPFPGVEVKLADDGEILAKGQSVMCGYHNQKQATDEVIIGGWLRTGDLGSFDSEGYLRVIGRKKEMFKTSNDKHIMPILIEEKLSQLDLIDMALVIAEGRPFVTCLLFPDFDNLKKKQIQRDMENLTAKEFFESAPVQVEINDGVYKVNTQLNKWKQIQRYSIIFTPLSVETGELTPKMNIRRKIVEEKYAEDIDMLYA